MQKLQLHLPLEGTEIFHKYLKEPELQCVWQQLQDNNEQHTSTDARLQGTHLPMKEWNQQGASAIRNLIVAHSDYGSQQERIVQLTQKLHDDFDGTTLRVDMLPDPPVRGRYGYAYIPLKETAVPHRSKAFHLHGEKLEAMKTITQEWLDADLVERRK